MMGSKKKQALLQELFTFTFDKSSTWVTNEFVSLTNLSKSAHQHQDSATHLQVSLKMQELIFSKMDMRKVMIQKKQLELFRAVGGLDETW